MTDLRHFHYWCQEVLPLVYDDALSYSELLCRVVDYLNKMVDNNKEMAEDMEQLRSDLAVVQKWIADFKYEEIDKIISDYIAHGVFFGLTDAGYFFAWIPHTWSSLHFRTTGKDISVPTEPEYGHLCIVM